MPHGYDVVVDEKSGGVDNEDKKISERNNERRTRPEGGTSPELIEDARAIERREAEESPANGMEKRERLPSDEHQEDSSAGVASENLVQIIRNEVKNEVRQEVHQIIFEAEVSAHSPESLKAYGEVDPSFPGAILDMARKEQQAQHDIDLIPIKAEARAFTVASICAATLPWGLILFAGALLLAGKDTAAYVTGVIGVLGGGVQLVSATRPRRRDSGKEQSK